MLWMWPVIHAYLRMNVSSVALWAYGGPLLAEQGHSARAVTTRRVLANLPTLGGQVEHELRTIIGRQTETDEN